MGSSAPINQHGHQTCWWRAHRMVILSIEDKSTDVICVSLTRLVHGAYMGSTWGRQDPGGPYVGPMNLASKVYAYDMCKKYIKYFRTEYIGNDLMFGNWKISTLLCSVVHVTQSLLWDNPIIYIYTEDHPQHSWRYRMDLWEQYTH